VHQLDSYPEITNMLVTSFANPRSQRHTERPQALATKSH